MCRSRKRLAAARAVVFQAFFQLLISGEQLPDGLMHPVYSMIQLLIFFLQFMKTHIHGEKHMAIAAGTGKAKLILIGSSVGRILFGFRQNVIQNQNISFFQRKVHEFRTGNRQQLHVIAAGGTGNMGISLDIGIASAFGTIIYR